jgi:hypothetical protein
MGISKEDSFIGKFNETKRRKCLTIGGFMKYNSLCNFFKKYKEVVAL